MNTVRQQNGGQTYGEDTDMVHVSDNDDEQIHQVTQEALFKPLTLCAMNPKSASQFMNMALQLNFSCEYWVHDHCAMIHTNRNDQELSILHVKRHARLHTNTCVSVRPWIKKTALE